MRFIVVLVIAVALLAGCADAPGADGRYATPGRGGWDNFRAEVFDDRPDLRAEAPTQDQYGVPSLRVNTRRPSVPALPCRPMSG